MKGYSTFSKAPGLEPIGLYTPIIQFWQYATCSQNKDGGRTHIQSRETIGRENHGTCVKLRPRKLRPAFFGADSKTRIFYKYIVFKHSFSFTQFPLQRQHTPYSVTLFHQQTSKSINMDGPCKHSFLQNTLTNSASETLTVLNHRKK